MNNDSEATHTVPLGGFPRRLGPCRLVKPLGGGAMGTVYLAEMEEARAYARPGSSVAVKVLHPAHFSAAGAFKRFLREAELGKALDHPAVRRTFDVDAVSIGPATCHFLVRALFERMSAHLSGPALDAFWQNNPNARMLLAAERAIPPSLAP